METKTFTIRKTTEKDIPCQGLGKKFFFKLLRMIKDDGYSNLEWSCLDWNASSIEFYKKIGAKQENGRVYFDFEPKNE